MEGQEGALFDTYTPRYIPRVDLSLSKDGAITWSTIVSRNLNPIGKRRNILRWDRLGRANVITCKFRFWGLSRFVSNDATMWIEP